MSAKDQVQRVFLEETGERLLAIENGLLDLETATASDGSDIVHKIFRQAHSIKAGAGLLELSNIATLAHRLENILEIIRTEKIVPSAKVITILLQTVDKLRDLLNNVEQSNLINISLQEAMLNMIIKDFGK